MSDDDKAMWVGAAVIAVAVAFVMWIRHAEAEEQGAWLVRAAEHDCQPAGEKLVRRPAMIVGRVIVPSREETWVRYLCDDGTLEWHKRP